MTVANPPTARNFAPLAGDFCSPVQARALGSAGDTPRPGSPDRGPERARCVLCDWPRYDGDPSGSAVCEGWREDGNRAPWRSRARRCSPVSLVSPTQVEGRGIPAGGCSKNLDGGAPRSGEHRRLGVSRPPSAATPPSGWPRLVTATSPIAHLSMLGAVAPLCGARLVRAHLDVQIAIVGGERTVCRRCVASWRVAAAHGLGEASRGQA